MQILVVEDEKLAAERLMDMITGLEPEAILLKPSDSIKATVRRLKENSHPDLIFMDIQLADGLCFEIFEKVEVDVPVIFTTAYNEYALKAFKVNSIDYLLKPIDKDELRNALLKFRKIKLQTHTHFAIQSDQLKQVMEMIRNPYKTRFAIHIGEHLKTILIEDVSYFFSSEKATFLRSQSGRDYAIDSSLDQLEQDLDPRQFFRVNRQAIVALAHIKDIVAYSGNRYKLHLNGGDHEEMLVSREKATAFKRWLDK